MSSPLIARIQSPTPKKILALDGGGIRGMITVEVLAEIESLLRRKLGRGEDFVLADYFDFVSGTSTGAIIAACISLGMKVADLRKFYIESGEQMFDKASVLKRFHHKYEDEKLAAKMREVFGADTTLGSDRLRTVLMMVMRNASTDSPWPVSNNPFAKYNQRGRADCNLDIPLWQLVRASTAAPTYFPPEVVKVGDHEFVFVDGGITPYNNPAFQSFLMATVEPYKMNWATGEGKLLVVSIGTGTSPQANAHLGPDDMNLLYNAGSVPSALMYAALNEQDLLCRVFGKCLAGEALDREVGTLIGAKGPVGPNKLFTYLRYNAELSTEGLQALGLAVIEPADVQKLDSVAHVADLQRVGRAVAKKVRPEHFSGFGPEEEEGRMSPEILEMLEGLNQTVIEVKSKASETFYVQAEPPPPPPDEEAAAPPRELDRAWSEKAAAAKEAAGDLVDCSVFAPPTAAPGGEIMLQAFAHLPENADEARAFAREQDEAATRRGYTTLDTRVARGSTLTFEMKLAGATVEDSLQHLIWRGRTACVSFIARISDAAKDSLGGRLIVCQDGAPIGRIVFQVKVGAAAKAGPEPTGEARRYHKAFISYASKDRTEVLKRVQMLRLHRIEFFQDVLSLDPGQRWEQELYKHIDDADLFLLFWSSSASASDWVRKELDYAAARNHHAADVDPDIVPVIIEGPPPPPPPEGYEYLHFDDRLVYFME